MKQFLRITVRFVVPEPTFHGQRDGGEAEWPPSPLRLFQALVDAIASHWQKQPFARKAQPTLQWLEHLGHPEIVAPSHKFGTPFRIAVPNNDLDAWARPLSKGNKPKKQPNEMKTMKLIQPVYLAGEAVHYLFTLPGELCPHLEILRYAARSITHLGWGIDMAVGDAEVLDAQAAAQLDGVRWRPSAVGGVPLRVPKLGTLDDLARKHADFLNRVTIDGFRPVPPLRIFDIVRYRRDTDPMPRPYSVFKLVDDNDDTVSYPHAKLIHIAGMVRHTAIELMKQNPPRDLRGLSPEQWVDQYVTGHAPRGDLPGSQPHTQFSYIPLPSTGHEYTDPAVRRVMIVAPLGDEAWLDHLSSLLDGQLLVPLPGTILPPGTHLQRIPHARHDGVRNAYTSESRTWASFTPVILPGHDDHKPGKTHKLILKALAQSGIDQPCEFEWSVFSRFPKSYGAQKYVPDETAQGGKRPVGYIRPDHLLRQTAVHLRLSFESPVPGPITIGAGRHCGFGLFAASPAPKAT
ncbi:MAG: type I-U CRISPR-associated protein Cas5/Cas6 [Planctomycetaceae bacterium]|nr:type I-U CRISPR-associated protein Cas5/Cas6 [Planctomycetaceae bacterium]